MRRARVTVDHRPPDRAPIRVKRGDVVTLGERDTDWPDFIWTTLAQGLGGWIPLNVFDLDADTSASATAREDYDTRELAADAGQLITVEREHAGWWWAFDAQGRSGWIPARSIELIEEHQETRP
ncbi:SH3 domain-containing protein [Pseudoxanthomonas composti]|nr:SH3 domain-containing protein [Pseudoxanthomonas composti]